MTEHKLIEVWRKEFEDYLNKTHEDKSHRLIMWVTWLSAKRSQPVVVLPEYCKNTPCSYSFDCGYEECLEDVKDLLTAAGIQFKVEE